MPQILPRNWVILYSLFSREGGEEDEERRSRSILLIEHHHHHQLGVTGLGWLFIICSPAASSLNVVLGSN